MRYIVRFIKTIILRLRLIRTQERLKDRYVLTPFERKDHDDTHPE